MSSQGNVSGIEPMGKVRHNTASYIQRGVTESIVTIPFVCIHTCTKLLGSSYIRHGAEAPVGIFFWLP